MSQDGGSPPLPPPPPGPAVPPMPRSLGIDAETYAGFWQRVGARLIDALVLGGPLVVLGIVLFAREFRGLAELSAGTRPLDLDRLGPRFAWFTILSAALGAAYEILLVHLRGQTLGKMALRIRIVRADDRTLPGWGAATIRWFVPTAVAWIPYVGVLGVLVYLWMLWDPMRQGLHDKAAGTIVVRI